MAQHKPWRMDFVLSMNIHEAHVWNAEEADRQKLEADLRRPKNEIKL